MIDILDKFYDYNLFHLTKIEDVDNAYKKAFDKLELKVGKAITRQIEL